MNRVIIDRAIFTSYTEIAGQFIIARRVCIYFKRLAHDHSSLLLILQVDEKSK